MQLQYELFAVLYAFSLVFKLKTNFFKFTVHMYIFLYFCSRKDFLLTPTLVMHTVLKTKTNAKTIEIQKQNNSACIHN